MAAKKQVDPREAAHLASEDATELWADIRSAMRFTRRVTNGRDAGSRYHHRLLYLMTAAVYRSVQHVLTKSSFVPLLDTIEAYADRHATFRELENVFESRRLYHSKKSVAAGESVADAVLLLLDDYKVIEGVDFVTDAMGYIGAVKAGDLLEDDIDGHSVWNFPSFQQAKQAHEKLLCGLIRDIFGNPYRSVAFDPAWRTETATGLALKMYDEKQFAAMPILADALQEAGCEQPEILAHCREPGTHVRGCWVIDLVLGKE